MRKGNPARRNRPHPSTESSTAPGNASDTEAIMPQAIGPLGRQGVSGQRPLSRVASRRSGRTPPMTPELIAILAVGVAICGIVLNAQRAARSDTRDARRDTGAAIGKLGDKIDRIETDVAELRREHGDLRERMAKLEGLLEGLREAVSGRRDAA